MNLLANSGYIIVNKEIIKKIGLHEAIILGELCSEYSYWEKNNKLDNGFFYSTRENIEENTGLTPYQQRTPIANLEKMGIVLIKSKGMPLQKWYSLNLNALFDFFNTESDLTASNEETLQQEIKKLDNKKLENLITSNEENLQQDRKKLYTNNNKNKNNKNNNEDDDKGKVRENVHITQEQYSNLIKKYGRLRIERTITRLDLYKKSTGKKYEDDYATLLLWIDSDLETEKRNTKGSKRVETDGVWWQSIKEKYGENLEGLYANRSF